MKKGFLVLVLLLVSWFVSAQIGHFGKRLIVNTDLINGLKRPFSGLGVEYALKRNLSVTASYFGSSTSGDYNFADTYDIQAWLKVVDNGASSPDFFTPTSSFIIKETFTGGNPAGLKSVSSGKFKNTIRGADLSFRFYYNSFRSSPFGTYLSLGCRYSKQNYTGNFFYPDSLLRYYYTGTEDIKLSFTRFYKESNQDLDAQYSIVEPFIGFGRQIIISKRFCIDITTNFGYAFSKKADPLFADDVLRSTIFKRSPDAEAFNGNVFSFLTVKDDSRTAFSFSFFVKFGYLLY